MSAPEPSASGENFAALRQDPFFGTAVDLIVGYLAAAFDDPSTGEVERWTLSARPSTHRTAECERLFTLNIGPMEVLYVERLMLGIDITDYRLVTYVSEAVFTADTGRAFDQLETAFPLLRFHRTDMASADGDGLVIEWFRSEKGAEEQFSGLPLAAAIRGLAELLEPKGRGPYKRFHNHAFATHVLGRIGVGELVGPFG
ncbi:hypothetical protein [Nocardia farcinica]|uniref:hypothetical protein n=1 Tax=Nocardia farcinica TaxID=37329 RepID=UPI00245556F4|nr:hypothetical protein [Nocardia farcinica]